MTERFTIESTALPAGTRVAAYEGRERLSETFAYQLWLLVPAAAAAGLDPESALLAEARFARHRDDGSLRRQVHGIIAALELLEDRPGGDSLYRAELVPTVWRLKLSRHSRVWVDQSLREIVREVFTRAGLDPARYEDRLTGEYPPLAHVCQYRESDFDFVARCFEREGIYFTFEHSDRGDTLVYLDDRTQQGAADDPVVSFRAELGGGSGGEGARYLRRGREARAARVVLDDHDPRRPPRGESPVDPRGAGELRRHLEDPFSDDGRGRRLAALRAEAERAEQESFVLEGRIGGVAPGRLFRLAGHPRAEFDGELQCVAVSAWGRSFTGPAEFARWLPSHREGERMTEWMAVTATPRAVQFRPPLATPRPRVAGVTVGRVDGPADSPYAQLDAQGRYLVKLHFDEREGPAGTHSARVRMAQPHAGSPEGWHLPLRRGTEVMLSFVGGDPDRPVITGAVPDADTVSPVTALHPTQNVFHTGSDNRLELEDAAGAQHVDLSTPAANSFVHLGAPHGGHGHHYIASTDADGLIRTGQNYHVTVGGAKRERVGGAVTEDYDQTRRTEVAGAVDERYHDDHCVTVVGHCQESYLATQTTEVATRAVETSASQETRVRGELSEQHGTHTATVVGDWSTRCAERFFQTGSSSQRDGTLQWTIRDGAMIKAASVTIRGPRLRMSSRTTRTINRPDEVLADGTQHHLAGNKFEAGLSSLALNGLVLSQVGLRLGFLTGLGMEASTLKAADTLLSVSLGGAEVKFLGGEVEVTPLAWTCLAVGLLV